MLYDIGARVTHSYEDPSDAGHHLLRLLPADLPGVQRVIASSLDVIPTPAERSDRRDFFGNLAVEVVFREAHEEVEFSVQARVERFANPPTLDFSPSVARLQQEIADYRGLDPLAPHHFLGASPRVQPDPAMTRYARDIVMAEMTTLAAIEAVGLALHQDMRFDDEATTVDTPPAEAFSRRHGVCQDFTHIMIACLRGIGVPAGYVSGYLRTIPPRGEPRLEGADAMHAWVRAWCGKETGWVEYDPTNALVVAADHVVVARGRDYGDVAPVKGVLRASGTQKSKMTVDVKPVEVAA